MTERIATGVTNLDAILDGGIPVGSLVVLSGPPGSGKTILAQQISFHGASADFRVLYFGTLAEPVAKTLVHLRAFEFFDGAKVPDVVEFIDLDMLDGSSDLSNALASILAHVKRVKPSLVVIDSFKMLDDLAASRDELRKFAYQLAVNLMAWGLTAILVGEYACDDYQHNPLFSIIDGIVVLTQKPNHGEQQRYLQIVKMRGVAHQREEHPFVIGAGGIELFAPRVALSRTTGIATASTPCRTGIHRLDELAGAGISWGSSVLLAGASGTGKTIVALELVYRGACMGEKGLFITFEQTADRLITTARGMGWDLERQIEQGLVEILYIPEPDIRAQLHLEAIRRRVAATSARRIVIDSLSVFLHKLTSAHEVREMVFHLCSLVYNQRALGIFTGDIPAGSGAICIHGVENTVVDTVILLSYAEEDADRVRYIEVCKERGGGHYMGRHQMEIRAGGIAIFPSYGLLKIDEPPTHTIDPARRVASGVPGLDEIVDGGLLRSSTTLISGSAGVGKSTLVTQFLLAGAAAGEHGLYLSLEESAEQRLRIAAALGLPMQLAVDNGLIEVIYASRDDMRAAQFLTALGDRIAHGQKRRIALDGITRMMSDLGTDELRRVLYRLAVRFKALDATSLFTIEASSLYSPDLGPERRMSPIADNLFVMRYRLVDDALEPTITIVKTRGSRHDPRTHRLGIGRGGLRIGAPLHASSGAHAGLQ